jgi:hypothetical protein
VNDERKRFIISTYHYCSYDVAINIDEDWKMQQIEREKTRLLELEQAFQVRVEPAA